MAQDRDANRDRDEQECERDDQIAEHLQPDARANHIERCQFEDLCANSDAYAKDNPFGLLSLRRRRALRVAIDLTQDSANNAAADSTMPIAVSQAGRISS